MPAFLIPIIKGIAGLGMDKLITGGALILVGSLALWFIRDYNLTKQALALSHQVAEDNKREYVKLRNSWDKERERLEHDLATVRKIRDKRAQESQDLRNQLNILDTTRDDSNCGVPASIVHSLDLMGVLVDD